MFIMIQFRTFLYHVLSFQPSSYDLLCSSTLNVRHNWWKVYHPVERFFAAGVSISMGTKIFPSDFCSTKQ
jgi:hypothetical protein